MNPDVSTAKARPTQRRPPNLQHARVWFITAADSPVGTVIARQAIEKGDIVVAGALSVKIGQENHPWRNDFTQFVDEIDQASARGSVTVVGLNPRLKEDCQAAVAEATKRHGRIDILFICNSQALLGTLPELTATPTTRSTIPSLFANNLFSPVNLILATLPHFRSRSITSAASGASAPTPNDLSNPPSATNASSRTASISGNHTNVNTIAATASTPSSATGPTPTLFTSPATLTNPTLPSPRPRVPSTPTLKLAQNSPCAPHILLHSTTAAHLGTPGLAAYCASQRAIEGYCDSLAYEVAPFGVRVTVLQSPLEVGVLAGGGLIVVPRLRVPTVKREYGGRRTKKQEVVEADMDDSNAPFARGTFARILASLPPATDNAPPLSETRQDTNLPESPSDGDGPPQSLPKEITEQLLAETVHAIMAIAGHANPPARHIVGLESVGLVKEKLRGFSEELEEFLGVSSAVDL